MAAPTEPVPSFDAINRREFIAASAAAGAAVGLTPLSSGAAPRSMSDMSFIHLFLPGGWPCNDLWDPKPYSPFRAGMRGSELTSTVKTIPTSVCGLYLGHSVRHVADIVDRGLIVRSLVDESNCVDHLGAQRRMIESLTFDQQPVEHFLDFAERDCFGKACLAATSASQARHCHVRIMFPFLPFQALDAHEFGGRFPDQMACIYIMASSILRQLEETGQLDRTILCISSEFNRTIAGRPLPGGDLNTGENLIIESERDYGFHAHFAEANSIVFFGGPFKRGFVYGKTGPKHPMRVVENPVTLADIHATLAVALNATPREGRVINDLFA